MRQPLVDDQILQGVEVEKQATAPMNNNSLQVDGRPPVLTAISQSNGNGQNSTPHRIKTP